MNIMNPIAVLKIMGKLGARYRESKIHEIIDYVGKMCDNGRVIIISDENGPFSVMFYSMTDQPEEFLKKGQYEYKSHDAEGKIIYVEKLISKGWNRELRHEFEAKILEKYPQMERGVWHRHGRYGDHEVISKIRRRNEHV